MSKSNALLILLSQLVLLIIAVAVALFGRPEAERFAIMLGWAVASLNFTTAMVVNLRALQKSFEAFKLALMVWTSARLGAMLAILFFVIKCKRELTMPFSGSLLSCFVVYIIVEVAFFYNKAKRMMS
ncbi:MAG: hypothetical protein V1913_01560 [Fibrobacterota bacterium]